MERERLGSRLGFILLSAGCAIGCGNVWKFPWLCGQSGGGGFVLIYLIFLVILGVPAMTMEFALGRASQKSPVRMYQALEKPKQKWHLHGYVALVGNIALMAFYTVVCGWMINYFIKYLTGNNADIGFTAMTGDAKTNVLYLAITVALGFGILCFGLQGGLERVTKVMMIGLLALIIVLAVHSCTLEGAGEGLSFYLIPDFSKINGSVVVSAMNQAFFTLSVGIGSMAIFGSYIGKERRLFSESITVISLDTFVAIVAGVIIFPACFTFHTEVTTGPGLLFDTMASVFNNMEGGRWWGALFFLFMVFAAFSTVLAVFENILSCVREMFGWKRPVGALICAVVVFLLSLTTALGFSVWSDFVPFAKGTTFLDFWDFIVSSNLIPIGAIVIAIFCCSEKFGWGWKNFMEEANSGRGLAVKNWMKPFFFIVLPVAVIALYIYGLITFKWQ